MNRYINYSTSFENAGTAREIELENKLISPEYQLHQEDHTRMFKHQPVKSILASNYLCKAEPYLSSLISPEKFKEIIFFSRNFPGNLTSFLGFEIHLGDSRQRADWAFAISGAGGDREVLVNLMKNGNIPKQFLLQPEWRHISDFSAAWADQHSPLREKVKCFWMEFDMPESLPEVLIPSVFFGPEKLPENVSAHDSSQYSWLVGTALPLLRGQCISKSMERRVLSCIKKMPEEASLFQVGTMLSRSTNDVRLYINRITPKKIVPYLNAIGWSDTTGDFRSLVADLEKKAERFVLSFDVADEGIGPRIGLECSFAVNRYHEETRWSDLLDYLVEQGACLPEKRDAVLQYPSVESMDDVSGGVMKPLASASRHLEDILTGTIVRYISHIKVVYHHGRALEAKAYPAVRLFEHSAEPLIE